MKTNNGPRGIASIQNTHIKQYPGEAFVSPVYDEKYSSVQICKSIIYFKTSIKTDLLWFILTS